MTKINESTYSYKDGYNRGFFDGQKKSGQSYYSSPYKRGSYNREIKGFNPDYEVLDNILRQSSRSNIQKNKENQEYKKLENIARAYRAYFTEEFYNKVENNYKILKRNYNSYPKKLIKIPNGTYAVILVQKKGENNKEVHEIYYSAIVKVVNKKITLLDYYEPFSNSWKTAVSSSVLNPKLNTEEEYFNVITYSNLLGGKGDLITSAFSYGKKLDYLNPSTYEIFFFQSTIIFNIN